MALPGPLFLLILGGGAYLLLAGKKTSGSAAGNAAQPGTITIPPITIPGTALPDHPDVSPENTPQVIVTPPVTTPGYTTTTVPAGGYATGDKSSTAQSTQQVITQQLPNIINQAAQAVQNATGIPVPNLPAVVVPTTPTIPTTPQAPTPIQTHETEPVQDPHGTVALAKAMIDAEGQSGWKSALQDRIRTWQSMVGLSADGKFGPNAAYKMAEEVGILPIVRYWTKATQLKADLQAYRDRLYTMAANADNHNPALAAALRSSAGYEQGQTYGVTNPKPIDSSARYAQATALKSAMGTT
jgi:hypothetical protein